MPLYLGLISGTSMDAIDAALLDITDDRVRVLHTLAVPYADALRTELQRTISQPEQCSLDGLGQLDVALGGAFADVALQLLQTAGVAPKDIAAIGSHGQTIRHRTQGERPFTWQMADPNLIAEKTGITTVADFRRRDIAAGGEGAPLLPIFHRLVLGHPAETRVVVNIGGIANLTWLPPDGPVIGFDTGPGNCLMDEWAARHLGVAFDRNGEWGSGGKENPALLARLLNEPYFRQQPPKSTGRELFNLKWLDAQLSAFGNSVAPQDVQATLCDLTAAVLSSAIQGLGRPVRVLLCGGGSHNHELKRRLALRLPDAKHETTDAHGISADFIEAAAFAWLAYRTLQGLPGNLPSVTGARHEVILGAIHPGRPTVTHL